jgi:low temperature requirement protein LtrA
MAERYGLLMIITLGEIIVSLLGSYSGSTPARSFVDIILAFLTALCMFHLYFRAETSHHHKHAMRRNAFTAVFWSFTHVLIAIAIISIAVCMKNLLSLSKTMYETNIYVPVHYEFQSVLGASFALLFYSFCVLTLLHLDYTGKDRQDTLLTQKKPRIRQYIRLLLRMSIGTGILLISLFLPLYPSTWILLAVSLSFLYMVIEEYGRVLVDSRHTSTVSEAPTDL